MKKIRLTESELTNIIKRVISEQNKDVVIPKVISDKQKEFSNMAKQIIQKHKEFCEYMISNKNKFPEIFTSNNDSNSMDCDFVTKRFAEQPLSLIALGSKNGSSNGMNMMMTNPGFRDRDLKDIGK
jgi:hypothetical protein